MLIQSMRSRDCGGRSFKYPKRRIMAMRKTSKAFQMALPCAAILLVALLLRLALLAVTKSYLAPERSEVVNVAQSLAAHGGFANAFSPTSGPTAHVSPIYPLLLSLLYRWFGTGQAGEIAQEVFACCLASLLWGSMPIVSRIFCLGPRIGTVAGLMGALLPLNRWAETKGSFEAPLAGVTMVALFCAYGSTWRHKRASTMRAAALGILGGLAILVSATLGAAAAVLLLLSSLRLRRDSPARAMTFALVTAAVMLAVLLPWGIRNYYVLGGFVPTRSNFGLELQVSNNDLAKPRTLDNAAAFKQYHPHEGGKELQRLENLGEIAYSHQKLREALGWIRSHPERFMNLTLWRIRYFWLPDMKRPAQTLLLALITLAAVFGGFRLYRQDRFLTTAFVSVLLAYSLIYYVVQSDARYIYPVSWIIYFLAADWVLGVSKYAAKALHQSPAGADFANEKITSERDIGMPLRASLAPQPFHLPLQRPNDYARRSWQRVHVLRVSV
jgi:hypothetical protein